MIFARKIDKIYMIFSQTCPNFTLHLAKKCFFVKFIFFGGEGHMLPSSPISYTNDTGSDNNVVSCLGLLHHCCYLATVSIYLFECTCQQLSAVLGISRLKHVTHSQVSAARHSHITEIRTPCPERKHAFCCITRV